MKRNHEIRQRPLFPSLFFLSVTTTNSFVALSAKLTDLDGRETFRSGGTTWRATFAVLAEFGKKKTKTNKKYFLLGVRACKLVNEYGNVRVPKKKKNELVFPSASREEVRLRSGWYNTANDSAQAAEEKAEA